MEVQNPLTGRSKGTYGKTSVFYTMHGKNLVRSKNTNPVVSQSTIAVAQRDRQKAAVISYKKNKAFVDTHFKISAVNMSAFNLFMKWNIMQFDNVTKTLLPAKVPNITIGTGILDVITAAAPVAVAGLKFTVAPVIAPNVLKSKTTDLVCVIQYNESTGLFSKTEATRATYLPATQLSVVGVAGAKVHVFVMSHEVNMSLSSNSVYCGVFTALV